MRIRDIIARAGALQGSDMLNIVSFALSMRKEEVLTRLDGELDEEKADRVLGLVKERRQGKPLAYITGEKEFYSQPFFVDKRVLIPRPETELLVEEALTIIEEKPAIGAIMDMGTGSGIIGNTIARLTGKDVICVDVSRDAIDVAEKNGRSAGISERLTFICSDLFGAFTKGRRFDMIVANLPYVAESGWDDVMIDVREFEPSLALLGGRDGLDIYRRFVQGLPEHLSRDGYVLCEIGADGQAKKMVDLFTSCGLGAEVKKDLARRERVIIGSWTNLS